MKPNPLRDSLLDAALAVIARVGACRMTLEAVAAEAQASKGGLLYHFPDKEALLRGLLDRHLDRRAACYAQAAVEHGATTAAEMRARVEVVGQPDAAPGAMPLLGILALEPKLLARPQAEAAQLVERLRADPQRMAQALVVLLASTGLIVSEALGTLPLTAAERAALIAELQRLATQLH
jgi:AcrR family transcriptional regulator